MRKLYTLLLCIILLFTACTFDTTVEHDNDTASTASATVFAPNLTETPTVSGSALPTLTPTPEEQKNTQTPFLTSTATVNAVTATPTLQPTKAPNPTQAPTQKPTPKPTPKPTQAPTQKPTATPSPTPRTHATITDAMLQKIEKGFLDLVNEERQKQGAGILTTNAYLDNYAVVRSGEIVTLFSHTRPDGTNVLEGIDYSLTFKPYNKPLCLGKFKIFAVNHRNKQSAVGFFIKLKERRQGKKP
jgi:hypothetical protein